MTKSPLTGLYLFCITGGKLGPALRRCGYDVIVLTGRAQEPVYVEATGGKAKIRSAAHLWGLDTLSTQEYIRDELPAGKLAISCIGPGGERQVPYACLLNERRALGAAAPAPSWEPRTSRPSSCARAPKRPRWPTSTPSRRPRSAVSCARIPSPRARSSLHGSVSTVAVTLNAGSCRPRTGGLPPTPARPPD